MKFVCSRLLHGRWTASNMLIDFIWTAFMSAYFILRNFFHLFIFFFYDLVSARIPASLTLWHISCLLLVWQHMLPHLCKYFLSNWLCMTVCIYVQTTCSVKRTVFCPMPSACGWLYPCSSWSMEFLPPQWHLQESDTHTQALLTYVTGRRYKKYW